MLARLPLAGCALLVPLLALAEPPKPADPADDPLPEGAKVRFGISRPILRGGPHVGLVGPKFEDFLAPAATGVRRYNLGTGRPLGPGVVGAGQVVVSADGKRAAVARVGTLTVVDVASGKTIHRVRPPEGVLIAGTAGVSLSAKGDRLAYGGRGKDGKGAVVVCDVGKNEAVARLETAQAIPVYPTLSPDGTVLVTHGPPPPAPTLNRPEVGAPEPKKEGKSDDSRFAQVWDVATGEELFQARVSGTGGAVVSAAFPGDGSFVALSAGDGPVDLFDVKTGKRTRTLLGRKGQGVKVAVSPDGKTVAAVAADYRVQRWSSDGKPLDLTEPPPALLVAQISGLQFADNERVVAWQTQAQFVAAWEAPTGRLLSPLTDHIAAIKSIAIPKGGKDLYTSGNEGRVVRWDLATGTPDETITLHPARLPNEPLVRPSVTLSADATRALGSRFPLEFFDLTTGRDLFVVPLPARPPAPLAASLSRDGLKLVAVSRKTDAGRPGSCVVWDLAAEKRLAEFDVPDADGGSALGAALSPDGTRLLLTVAVPNGAGKQTLRVIGYDLKAGKKLAEVDDPQATGNISLAAVDNRWAVGLSSGGRLWTVDYAGGKMGDTLERQLPGATAGPVVSPDGKRFAIGLPAGGEGPYGVRVFDWETRKELHTFTGHAAPVTAIQFSPDGKFLASGSQDTSVLLWDLGKKPAQK